MDHDEAHQPLQGEADAAPRARTFVVRWWRESGEAEEERLRGTVRDIGGSQLGAFHGFEALVGLLRRHVLPRRRDG